MRLENYNNFKIYRLRKAPINNQDLLWLKKEWFNNLDNYTFVPGFRKNREKKDIINYFYSENNLYLLINRLLITKASGVDLYQIPLTDSLMEKLSSYIVLSEDVFVSESELNQVKQESIYIIPGEKLPPVVIVHQESGRIFYRDRKKEEYVDEKIILISYKLPLIENK